MFPEDTFPTVEVARGESTRACPLCSCASLVGLSSQQRRICPDCRIFIRWTLDPGQPPLVGPARTLKA